MMKEQASERNSINIKDLCETCDVQYIKYFR